MTRRYITILGLLSLLAIGGGLFMVARYANVSTDVPDSAMFLIDFELPTSRGIPWSSSTLENRVVVINFWAPWCLPCRNEIPYLVDIYLQYRPALQVIGIAIDQREAVRRFENQAGITYTSLIGELGGIELMQQYGNAGQLPLTLVFDRGGRLQRRVTGAFKPALLRHWLMQLL
jgi:thiol-disulfide isomerase/thioredoxin